MCVYPCHSSLEDQQQVPSLLTLLRDQTMSNSVSPGVTEVNIGLIFHKSHIFSNISFFRQTNQEKMIFVWGPSLPQQQHTLTRSNNTDISSFCQSRIVGLVHQRWSVTTELKQHDLFSSITCTTLSNVVWRLGGKETTGSVNHFILLLEIVMC